MLGIELERATVSRACVPDPAATLRDECLAAVGVGLVRSEADGTVGRLPSGPQDGSVERGGAMDGAVTYGPGELRAEIPCG